jgi:NADH-quinone oxidoreductase subunit E
MQRYDLRHLKDNFYNRMGEIIESNLKVGEVGIFIFEVGDFSHIQKSADFIKDLGHELMNSLKFNEVDWTIVVKKLSIQEITRRKEEAEKAFKLAEEKRIEAERVAKENAKAKVEVQKKIDKETKVKTETQKKPSVKKTVQRKRATTAKKKGK